MSLQRFVSSQGQLHVRTIWKLSFAVRSELSLGRCLNDMIDSHWWVSLHSLTLPSYPQASIGFQYVLKSARYLRSRTQRHLVFKWRCIYCWLFIWVRALDFLTPSMNVTLVSEIVEGRYQHPCYRTALHLILNAGQMWLSSSGNLYL